MRLSGLIFLCLSLCGCAGYWRAPRQRWTPPTTEAQQEARRVCHEYGWRIKTIHKQDVIVCNSGFWMDMTLLKGMK